MPVNRHKHLFYKAVLVILGIAAGLIIAESVLRIYSVIFLRSQSLQYDKISGNYNTDHKNRDIFKILCVGDSSTLGMGVRPEYSYPCQLLNLLEQKEKARFEITVRSSGGANSSDLVNRCEDYLKTGDFDLVIFQGGINDVHCFSNSRIPLYSNSFVKYLNRFKLFYLCKIFLGQKNPLPEWIDFTKSEDYGVGKSLFLDRDALRKIVEYNFGRLAAISNEHKALLWVQNYHKSGWMNPEEVLNKVLSGMNIEVVDQESVFNYAEGINVRSKDKWHPNNYGYYLIARIIYNKMIEKNIISGDKYDLYSEIDAVRQRNIGINVYPLNKGATNITMKGLLEK